ncbi:hypothetical protein UFOVP711_24 [uncultured Caudovirales phage]|uniref:Uncharacterized protein n=1 Tax=uncultured Caudovirales phage TaxID=2100421 RepID=A0A6J5NM16_9CAUD|nr:hypothetical protein UFOVP711_24 [uncultured Caudovirales phage]
MIKRWILAFALLGIAFHYGADNQPVALTAPTSTVQMDMARLPRPVRLFLATPTTTIAVVKKASLKPTQKPYERKWVTLHVDGKNVSIPRDKTYRCPNMEATIRKAGLKPTALWSYIAWRESRCTAKAIGWNYKKGKSVEDCKLAPASIYKRCSAISSYDSGVWQINSSWKTLTAQTCKTPYGKMEVLLDVDCNIKMVKALYGDGGLHHWGF